MAKQVLFPNTNLNQFRELFLTKSAYGKAIGEMDLRERAFDWKPTTRLEERVKSHIVDNALIKLGSGSLKVTSYLLEDGGNETTSYLSYGGTRLLLTKEGRDRDVGYFLKATQTPDGLVVRAESKREHYKLRTWAMNLIGIVAGLFLGIIPGVLFAIFLFFIEPRIVKKKIETYVWPPLSAFLDAGVQPLVSSPTRHVPPAVTSVKRRLPTPSD